MAKKLTDTAKKAKSAKKTGTAKKKTTWTTEITSRDALYLEKLGVKLTI